MFWSNFSIPFFIFKTPIALPASCSQLINSAHISLRKEKLSDVNYLAFPPLIYTSTVVGLVSFPLVNVSTAYQRAVSAWVTSPHSFNLPLCWIRPTGIHPCVSISHLFLLIPTPSTRFLHILRAPGAASYVALLLNGRICPAPSYAPPQSFQKGKISYIFPSSLLPSYPKDRVGLRSYLWLIHIHVAVFSCFRWTSFFYQLFQSCFSIWVIWRILPKFS